MNLMGLSNSSNLKILDGARLLETGELVEIPARSNSAAQLTPSAIQIYANDVVIKFQGHRPAHLEGTQRQKITKLTYKSLQRLAFIASNTDVKFQSMLTLTYPLKYPGDGKTVKMHLNKMLGCLRQVNSYLWFMEFQQRGAPHVHVLLTQFAGLKAREWASKRWYKIVESHDPKHYGAGTNWENEQKPGRMVRYAIKYASKPDQKWVPDEFQNVGRFWGCSRDVTPKMEQEIVVTHPRQVEQTLAAWDWQTRCHPDTKIRYNAAAAAREYLTTHK